MAYQPIQMADYKAPGFAEAILQSRQLQQQKEADRWRMLANQEEAKRLQAESEQRIKHQTFEDQGTQQLRQDAIQAQYTKLRDAGLGIEAENWAKLHGIQVPQQPMVAPQAVAQQPKPQVPQLYDNQDLGNFAKNTLAAPGPTQNAAQPQQAPGAGNSLMPALQEPAQAPMQGPPSPAPDAIAAATAQYEAQPQQPQVAQAPAPQIQNYSFNGQQFRYDPMEARRAQQEQNAYRADQLRQAFASIPDMQKYANVGAALTQGGETIKPGDILGLRNKDAAQALKEKEDAAKLAELLRTKQDVQTQIDLAHSRDAAIAAGKGGGGAPTTREEKQAEDVGAEILKTYGEDIGPKGIAVAQQKLKKQIENAKQGNPVDMTNLVDAMIRTNTGRAAIKAQYDLYVQHSGGTFDQFDKWLETAKNGGLGEGITKNLIGASQNSLTELYEMGAEGQRKYHNQYDTDPRTKTPAVKHKVKALENNIFGSMVTPKDVEAITWAKAHPSDPRSKTILQAHGLE